jgi:recombination associated protein RdgC
MSDGGSFAFLGEEFLTWLWYRLENEGGEFDLGEGRIVGVALDDFIVFAPRDDDETEQTLRKGVPTRSAEARAGLRSGHRLKKAKLTLAMSELVWSFTLDASTMGLRSIRLPDDDEAAESPEERSRERAANFLLLHDLVGALYRQFLALRLRTDYLSTDAETQASWMAAG